MQKTLRQWTPNYKGSKRIKNRILLSAIRRTNLRTMGWNYRSVVATDIVGELDRRLGKVRLIA